MHFITDSLTNFEYQKKGIFRVPGNRTERFTNSSRTTFVVNLANKKFQLSFYYFFKDILTDALRDIRLSKKTRSKIQN